MRRSQVVQKVPDARKAEEASEDSTAPVRQASSRRPDNADGALSRAWNKIKPVMSSPPYVQTRYPQVGILGLV